MWSSRQTPGSASRSSACQANPQATTRWEAWCAGSDLLSVLVVYISERTRRDVRTISRRDHHVRRELRAARLDAVPRAAPFHRAEHGALLDSGDHLRWQRPDDLRVAGLSRPRAGQPG